jgi:hypothetical protein
MSSDTAGSKERSSMTDRWWGKIIIGLIFGGLVFYLNNLFTELETGVQESVRINAIIALLYNTLGHMPTVIIIGALAALFVIWGIYQLITDRKES